MTHRGEIVLSVFSGIDLLGRGFTAEGFCVVSAGDMILGLDVRDFDASALRGHVTGVIGGPPCQDFSKARRKATPPTGYGLAMLREFERIVRDSAPDWFLCENVPCVPDVICPGYTVQRVDINALECGCRQRRARHFQFGSREGKRISVARRAVTQPGEAPCLATEGRRVGRAWAEFCALQGLPADFSLPDFTKAGRYKVVGNGVPLPMARAVAVAIRNARLWHEVRLCGCGCGRTVTGRRALATMACRKREQRRRDAAGVNVTGAVTLELFETAR